MTRLDSVGLPVEPGAHPPGLTTALPIQASPLPRNRRGVLDGLQRHAELNADHRIGEQCHETRVISIA